MARSASVGHATGSPTGYAARAPSQGGDSLAWAIAVPLAPVVSVIYSMGTVAGVLDPPAEFRVTEKAGGS